MYIVKNIQLELIFCHKNVCTYFMTSAKKKSTKKPTFIQCLIERCLDAYNHRSDFV